MSGEPVLVAMDFTADTLRLLLAQQDGTAVLRERWALPALADEDAWSWEVGGRLATLFAREGERRSALAIVAAAPGSVDPVTGRLLRSAGQPTWDGLAVVDALRRHINAPIAAESRTLAALAGEQWQGALAGVEHALYVSLRGEPTAALLIGGRPFRGASHEAGALPALPELGAGAPPSQQELSTIAGLLADATALLDPEVVVLDAPPAPLERLVPLLQRVLDRVAPGPHVVASKLGEDAALAGALRLAGTLAYEGGRVA